VLTPRERAVPLQLLDFVLTSIPSLWSRERRPEPIILCKDPGAVTVPVRVCDATVVGK
jgi:hypothetical protein